MLASTLITRANDILQDTTNVRWPEAELLRWLSDGQREVVLIKPEASVAHTTLQLTANNTKQSLPAAALQLIDVTRNMGADGATPGRAIRIIMREVLDAQRPDWHSETADSVVKHFMFDVRSPKTFYVYPRPATAIYIEMVYSVSPADLTTTSSPLGVDEVYANALLDYVLYRAYSKDSEYAGNSQRAMAHYQAFSGSLGVKSSNELAKGPEANSVLNPNNPIQAKVA